MPSSNLLSLQHYRVSLNEVGRPLTCFKSSREFVSVIADAMEAHGAAYFDANILHRDINVGNIMIREEEGGKTSGCLIDWDLCVRVDAMGKVRRQLERTGTWQLMPFHQAPSGSQSTPGHRG